MTRIEVDYNERDEEGRVIGGVSPEQLLALHEGDAVTLFDPVDHLRADPTVEWIEADARAVGFDVDWTSFEDEELCQQEPIARNAATVQSARTSSILEPTSPGVQARSTPAHRLAYP